MSGSDTFSLRVVALDDSVPGIRAVSLARRDGATLPSFTPGSHLVVGCGARTNAYSLTGESMMPARYQFSVLRLADGDGGSRWIHDELALGDNVEVVPPRSAFAPVATATKHLLIAGGIGVTPILSHARACQRWNREAQIVYTYREGFGAHVNDLKNLFGEAVELFTEPAGFMTRLDEVLGEQPIGTHLYVCGPGPMMDATCERAAAWGWPSSRVHLERFNADALDPGQPFEVTLTESHQSINVPSGVSLLEALEGRGVAVPSMCRQGVCGECRVVVRCGEVFHRDLYLSDEEKSSNNAMMCCVSRASGEKLEIAL